MFQKYFMFLVLLFMSSISFGLTTKGQVDLIPLTGVEIRSGMTTWSAKVSQPVQVNLIQVSFWNTNRRCNIIPVTSLSVKYFNDPYWYSANYGGGGYQVEYQYVIEAVKLDFYLENVDQFCIIKVYGFREINGHPQTP